MGGQDPIEPYGYMHATQQLSALDYSTYMCKDLRPVYTTSRRICYARAQL